MQKQQPIPRPFAVALVAAVSVTLGASVVLAATDKPAKPDVWQHRYQVEHARYQREHTLRKRVERRQGVRVRGLRANLRAANARTEAWHNLARARRVAVAHQPTSLEALRLASIAYQQPYGDLLRVAECESPGLDARLVNGESVGREHATGLMQFLPSTFASTPYAAEDILSPYANALAAGWMWAHSRRGEWACR